MYPEDNQIFEKVEIQPKKNDENLKEKEIELLVKILTHIPASAEVKKNDDNGVEYALELFLTGNENLMKD